MRIIIVTDYPNINGGAGKVALESAIALVPHVESVHVFTTIGEVPPELASQVSISTLGQSKVTELPLSESMIGGLWNKQAAQAFSDLLDGYDPADTLVHIHSWRDATTLSFVPDMIRRGFKFVVTAHDYGLACPIAGFYNERKQSACTLRGMSLGCVCTRCTNGQFVRKTWFVARHAMQVHRAKLPAKLKHLIVIGKLNERVMTPYLKKSAKVHLVENPISVQPILRSEAETSDTFVYIGRLSPEKGVSLALEAATAGGFKIRVVGSGVQETELKAKFPNVQFEGWCDKEKTQEILRTARALLFPSLWYEGQPLIVDEAAANGVPVIVSDISAAKEAVDDYCHGLAFRSGNLDSLISKMRLMLDDNRVRDFSKNGHEKYWNDPHTMERHIKKLLAVYSEVLSD